jgi:hypothetical protein
VRCLNQAMEKDLRTAYINKERAEQFINNLAQLHNDKAINDAAFNALQTEYSVSLQHALMKIEGIKQELNRRLALRSRQLGVLKQELANLDARFKVGQIPSAVYLRLSKVPQKKATALEAIISNLNSLLSSQRSTDISIAESPGLASFLSSRFQPHKAPADAVPGHLVWTPPAQTFQPAEAAAPTPPPDTTSVSNLHILPDRAYPGSSIGVIATVVNSGGDKVQHRTEFKINGRLEAINELTLEAGQSQEITFMTVAGTPGDYYVSVDNATGILRIIPSA